MCEGRELITEYGVVGVCGDPIEHGADACKEHYRLEYVGMGDYVCQLEEDCGG